MKRYHAHVDPSNRNAPVEGWDYKRYDGQCRMVAGHYMGNTPRHWKQADRDAGVPAPPRHTTVDRLLAGEFQGGVPHAEAVRADVAGHWPRGYSARLAGFNPARDIVSFDEEVLHPDLSAALHWNIHPDRSKHAGVTVALAAQAWGIYRGVYGRKARLGSWGLLRSRGHDSDQLAVAAAWAPALRLLRVGIAACYFTGDARADAERVALERRKLALLQPKAEPLACVDPTRYSAAGDADGAIESARWHLSLIRDAGFAGVIEWAQRPSVAQLSRFDLAFHRVATRFGVDR